MRQSQYFDDFTLGQKFVSKGRTVTEADIVAFANLTWDHNELHTDREHARGGPFGRRVAHGILGLAFQAGLSSFLTGDSILALLGINWEFVKPVYIGDTIHVEQTVAELRPASGGGKGVLTFAKELINQEGRVVQRGQVKVLLACRPR